MKIAIIGAGLAGLTLAHKLKTLDADITLFEKARGVGGRMATRYAEPYQFDHGAQYFTCRNTKFSAFIDDFIAQNIIRPWDNESVCFEHPKSITPIQTDEKKFIAVPKMNALCKALSNGLDIRLPVQVSDLQYGHGNRWQFLDQNDTLYEGFDWVISTAPAPQTQTLFPTNFREFEALSNTKMTGCYSLMLGYSSPLPIKWDSAFVKNSPIGWICINSLKPKRNDQFFSIIIQTTNEWAEAHLEDDQNEIQSLLFKEFENILGLKGLHPDHIALHRWRYAGVETPATKEFLIDSNLKLAACGDWCIEGRIEAAFLSAIALASHLEQTIFEGMTLARERYL